MSSPKFIKNYWAPLSHRKLNGFDILYIERNVADMLGIDKLIGVLASKEVRSGAEL